MFILRIGAHQKRQNILKLHLFYVKMNSRGELTFPALRKGVLNGMQPKILQRLPGQASIKTTMNCYVHVTDESMSKAIQQFEKAVCV